MDSPQEQAEGIIYFSLTQADITELSVSPTDALSYFLLVGSMGQIPDPSDPAHCIWPKPSNKVL